MKSIIKSLAVLTAALLPLVSCDKEGKDMVKPELSIVTESDVTVPYTGNENILVEFICKGDWTASLTFDGDGGWAEINGEPQGKGSGAVTVAVKANETSVERTATLTIKVAELTETVTLRQEAKKLNITFKHPSLLYTQEQFDKMKAAYQNAAAESSIKAALEFCVTRGDGGLTYDSDKTVPIEQKQTTDPAALYKSASGPTTLNINLLVAAAVTDDADKKDAYYNKAVEIMYSWASACKDVEYPVSGEGTEEEPNTGAGMYLARVMFPFFVTYDVLRDTKYISAEQKTVIEGWFRNIVKHIRASMNAWDTNDYFNKQEWQNHLCAHMWGLLSIGYVLEDASLVQFAIDSPENPRDFYELIQGNIFMEGDTPCQREREGAPAVQTGEIYDRYRHDTGPLKGLQYASLSLQVLSSAARTCYNNGIDMYAYTAPTGENLRLAYEFYSDFYATKYTKPDTSLKGGYYSGEESRMGAAGDMCGLFELGLNAYPDSKKIKAVLDNMPNRANNAKSDRQMHDQLGYTRLLSIDVDDKN